MKLTIAAVIGFLLAMLSTGTAQQSLILEHGDQSCASWVQKNKKERDPVMFTWVLGFVSGARFAASVPLRFTTDHNETGAWIDKYCADHPLDNIAKAAGALVNDLGRKRTAEESN